jgi:6-pyruvoyltetrahydropterin/6-carboxytetrahydropterin synthase
LSLSGALHNLAITLFFQAHRLTFYRLLHTAYFQANPMFRVTREIEFCYGHRLLNYDGKCRHLHGHNGRAVITLQGAELDPRGMLVDFADIKRKVQQWIDETLDHNMLLCQDDPLLPVLCERGERVFVMDCNPTAENIARLIYEHARESGLPVVEVVLWETEHCFSTYAPGT